MAKQVAKLTGIGYRNIKDVKDVIAPKDKVFIFREDNAHDSSGVAYRIVAVCRDGARACIGMLPDLMTLEGYVLNARSPQDAERNQKWLHAVRAIREQFRLDYESSGKEEWNGKVETLLYATAKGWQSIPIEAVEFKAWQQLPDQIKAATKLRQVSIRFPCEIM